MAFVWKPRRGIRGAVFFLHGFLGTFGWGDEPIGFEFRFGGGAVGIQ
jgi:hypothetical protein